MASQNAKQFEAAPHVYSYSLFDEQGRIVEVGELKVAANRPIEENYVNDLLDMNLFTNWVNSGSKSEVTRNLL